MAASAKGDDKKGSGGIVGILIVTVLALGAGGGFGFYLSSALPPPDVAAEAAQKDKDKEKDKDPAKPLAQVRLVELSPMIANLIEPKTAWMRIEASVVVEGEVENLPALTAKIGEDVVAYLKTMSLTQFEGPTGFQNLREDLNDRARIRGGTPIRELVVHGVIVE
jgi:flagellar FliL protein